MTTSPVPDHVDVFPDGLFYHELTAQDLANSLKTNVSYDHTGRVCWLKCPGQTGYWTDLGGYTYQMLKAQRESERVDSLNKRGRHWVGDVDLHVQLNRLARAGHSRPAPVGFYGSSTHACAPPPASTGNAHAAAERRSPGRGGDEIPTAQGSARPHGPAAPKPVAGKHHQREVNHRQSKRSKRQPPRFLDEASAAEAARRAELQALQEFKAQADARRARERRHAREAEHAAAVAENAAWFRAAHQGDFGHGLIFPRDDASALPQREANAGGPAAGADPCARGESRHVNSTVLLPGRQDGTEEASALTSLGPSCSPQGPSEPAYPFTMEVPSPGTQARDAYRAATSPDTQPRPTRFFRAVQPGEFGSLFLELWGSPTVDTDNERGDKPAQQGGGVAGAQVERGRVAASAWPPVAPPRELSTPPIATDPVSPYPAGYLYPACLYEPETYK